MPRFCCSAQIVAAAALAGAAMLAGCGTVELFGKYDLPESPEVAAAPWPRLVDTPAAPPVGVYSEQVPDPTEGVAAQADLGAAAAGANARAAELAPPVIGGAERAAMLAAARRAR
jgi:hypothetical protein